MTTTEAVAAPPDNAAARRYSEQLHTLVDRETRAYILGRAAEAADAGGYARPKEGEVTRALLDEAIAAQARQNPTAYTKALRRGRKVLAEREKAQRRERAGNA
jgi:hypothetical protein